MISCCCISTNGISVLLWTGRSAVATEVQLMNLVDVDEDFVGYLVIAEVLLKQIRENTQ